MTGTRRPRRHRETETRCHRETETETETVTSSAAAAPALPTANGGILRLDACLRRTSGRAGAVLAAGTDLMIGRICSHCVIVRIESHIFGCVIVKVECHMSDLALATCCALRI